MGSSSSVLKTRNLARLWAALQRPLLIVLAAAAVRLAVVGFLLAHQPPVWGTNEAAGIARQLALGHGFASPFHDSIVRTAWLAPVYPSLLACLFLIFGIQSVASAWAAILLNIVFASLAAAVILKLGAQHFGSVAGTIAAWAWAISPPVVVMPWLRWETSLSALVMAFVLMRTLRLNADSSAREWVACGCIWGFAALLNPALLAPLPALAILLAARRCPLRRVTLMLLICGLAILPWTIRNRISLGAFVPLRSNFWPEAYFGNVDFTEHPLGASMLYQREGELAFTQDLRGRVIEHVQSNKKEFARRTAGRMVSFWTRPPQFSPLPLLLFVTALCGIFLALRNGREWASFACVLGFYPLIYYLTYTFSRYRHPIEPVLYVLASYAVAELIRSLRKAVSLAGE